MHGAVVVRDPDAGVPLVTGDELVIAGGLGLVAGLLGVIFAA